MTHSDDPYRDPALYDLEYSDRVADVPFYLRLARAAGGPVLELGCGNGRLTLALARAGIRVDGLDVSTTMLEDLERKLGVEAPEVRERVRYSCGNFCTFEAKKRYSLVLLPFNALHHCDGLERVNALLVGVRKALRAGGSFAFDCYLPDESLYARDSSEAYEQCTFLHPRTGATVTSWEKSAFDPERRIHHVYYVYRSEPGGPEEEVHLQLHMFDRVDLRALFYEAGFEIAWEACDFAGSPMRSDSVKWVLELRRRDRPS